MKTKRILFINQSPNRMLCDIADVYNKNGWECDLMSGANPPVVASFKKIRLFTKYNRESIFSRLYSWIGFTWKAYSSKRTGEPYDRIFAVSNPPFLAFILPALGKRNKADTCMLIYDLYPDVLTAYSRSIFSKIISSITSRLNRKYFPKISRIFTPSESLADAVKKYDDREISVIYNWVDLSGIKPVDQKLNTFLQTHNLTEKFIVLYSGNFGKSHDDETLINAIQSFKHQDKIHFLFIGEGPGIDNISDKTMDYPVTVLPLQNDTTFPYSIASGNIALISYKNGFEGYSIPSKLPYYFATGTPVIMIGNPKSELARIITDNNLGYVVPNHKSDELVRLIQKLADHSIITLHGNIIDFVKENWSLKNAEYFYYP